MKIDLNFPFKELDGTIIKNGDKELQLRDIIVEVCMSTFKDEEGLSAEEKVKRYSIARSVYESKGEESIQYEMSLEDVASVKKLIGKAYSPLIVGQAFELLK